MLDPLDRQIIDQYQRGLPLTTRPYAAMAEQLGTSERDIIERLQALQKNRIITRVGPVFDHHRAGVSTLAALAVPTERLLEIADFVNQFEGINHNYEREHEFNMWFVVTAPTQSELDSTLDQIAEKTGMPLIVLPMEQAYHIDLGFKLNWQESL